MPCRYQFEKPSSLFLMELEGRITDREIDSFIEQVHSDPDFPTVRKQLIVARNTENSLTTGLLIELAGVHLSSNNKKTAVVIENEERYRQAIFDQWTRKEIPSSIQLFSVKEEAFQWLARF